MSGEFETRPRKQLLVSKKRKSSRQDNKASIKQGLRYADALTRRKSSRKSIETSSNIVNQEVIELVDSESGTDEEDGDVGRKTVGKRSKMARDIFESSTDEE